MGASFVVFVSYHPPFLPFSSLFYPFYIMFPLQNETSLHQSIVLEGCGNVYIDQTHIAKKRTGTFSFVLFTFMSVVTFSFVLFTNITTECGCCLLKRIKRELREEEDRTCRHYERQRAKAKGDGSLSHTRWIRGRSCPGEREGDKVQVVLCYEIHLDTSISRRYCQGWLRCVDRCTCVHV